VSELVFYLMAAATVFCALGVITRPNPVHSALFLVMTLFMLAVFYIILEAHLVAALQILVYAGAVMVLFLFVITLLNLKGDPDEPAHPLLRIVAYAVAATLAAGVAIVLMGDAGATGAGAVLAEGFGGTRALARVLFTDYLVAFELTSMLLLVAVVGAVVLAQRDPAPESPLAESGEDA
jgi:NADH-quinone oxidoreductase subunit J